MFSRSPVCSLRCLVQLYSAIQRFAVQPRTSFSRIFAFPKSRVSRGKSQHITEPCWELLTQIIWAVTDGICSPHPQTNVWLQLFPTCIKHQIKCKSVTWTCSPICLYYPGLSLIKWTEHDSNTTGYIKEQALLWLNALLAVLHHFKVSLPADMLLFFEHFKLLARKNSAWLRRVVELYTEWTGWVWEACVKGAINEKPTHTNVLFKQRYILIIVLVPMFRLVPWVDALPRRSKKKAWESKLPYVSDAVNGKAAPGFPSHTHTWIPEHLNCTRSCKDAGTW